MVLSPSFEWLSEALSVGSIDLLRKSGPDGHTVTEGRNEIDPKAKPATPVA
ncbi:hypothetical protein ACVWZX_004649, partial [Deinococcus sp. UYEF24]